ncbi:MAG: hypothetical protein RBT52_01710, partial [Sulfurimonas sp.]|nr:hypothetical protein [Sulfurimonas sp.]
MNQEELLLWNIREKQRKKRKSDDEVDEDFVFENVPKFKQAHARVVNTSIDLSTDTHSDNNYKLGSNLSGNTASSTNTSSQSSTQMHLLKIYQLLMWLHQLLQLQKYKLHQIAQQYQVLLQLLVLH